MTVGLASEDEVIATAAVSALPRSTPVELPALVIGEAAALTFGASVLLAVFRRERRAQLPALMKQSLRYLVIACLLLVPAAIIETWVTPLVLRWVG